MTRFLNKIHSFLLTYYNSFYIIDNKIKKQDIEYMNIEKSMVWVTFRKEGIHAYPASATEPELTEVSFLAHPHRHMFHFKVWIEVFHDDRDLEFILFKRWLEDLYGSNILELNHKSCEMIACDLHKEIITKYPMREHWIEVSEDGENGCFIQFPSTL